MDYRNILATGFLILCGAVFIHSLKSANAFPQGPNVSMGSNPIESWSGEWGNGYHTVDTVSGDFIITDFILSGHGDSCMAILTTNQNSYSSPYSIATGAWKNSSYRTANSQFNGNFKSGIKVPAGTTLYVYVSISGADCLYNISGYYTH